MPLHNLQHYTICPVDLEATKDFYVNALGLEVGYRPPLSFPGYWLWSAGVPKGERQARIDDVLELLPRIKEFTRRTAGTLASYCGTPLTTASGFARATSTKRGI